MNERWKIDEEEWLKQLRAWKQDRAKKIYCLTEGFQTKFSLFVEYLKQKGSVDDEHILYFPEKFPFSSEWFHAFFDLVTQFLEDKYGTYAREDCEFPNKLFWMKCEDVILEFFIMWGQGTCELVRLAKEEEIPKDHIGTLEEFQQYLKNLSLNDFSHCT